MKNGKSAAYMQSSYAQNQALMQALNQGNNRQQAASSMLPNLGSNSSVTIQVLLMKLSPQVGYNSIIKESKIKSPSNHFIRVLVREAQINHLTPQASLLHRYLGEEVKALPVEKVKDICNL